MEIYLVGGAVRDRRLQVEVKDRDWVVVGGNASKLIALGYKSVGKDFPVFLHPESHEEYALARVERKTGHGYAGFEFDASENVTLEEDLSRRDLTINAMAETEDGELIDPFDGHSDLEAGVLRHVSEAFSEDPVRILRVARFAARFHARGFTVHESTLALMKHMVDNGEVNHLVSERVWAETQRALAGDNPQVFFEVLRACGALRVLFPELEALYGVPQPAKWHPEIDTGVHTMMVLYQASLLSDDPEIRFAALVHDLGKATTPKDILPSHYGHEQRSVDLTIKLCKRLTIPNRYRDLAVIVGEFHGNVHRVFDLRKNTVLKLLQKTDAFRKPERFEAFLLSCEADSRGRLGLETKPYPQADYLRKALELASAVKVKDFITPDLIGEKIALELYKRQLRTLDALSDEHPQN
ncbi:MAG: multifunctional CCA addition/repair protein [Gammaproteobacteria bacterium]